MTSKALFLDRDGIINEDRSYPFLPEHIVFIDAVFPLCKKAIEKGYVIIVITNQSGVARGYFSEQQVNKLHEWMTEQFRSRGIAISAFYYCPYHKDGTVKGYDEESQDRKPNPGMIHRAQKDFGLDLSLSLMIGDNESDRIRHPELKSLIVKSRYVPDNYDIATLGEAVRWL